MVKKQVEAKLLAADFEWILAADEGKSHAKLQQKIADVLDESAFELTLLDLSCEGEEVEVVRVLNDLLGQFRLRRGQRAREVG